MQLMYKQIYIVQNNLIQDDIFLITAKPKPLKRGIRSRRSCFAPTPHVVFFLRGGGWIFIYSINEISFHDKYLGRYRSNKQKHYFIH